MKAIINIKTNGLCYIDENGTEKFVDFWECHENWIQYRKRKGRLTDERFEDVKNHDKYIGQRDICARPRFIEFFTRPFTRFEFEDSEEAFIQLKNDITSVGWSTLDLS